MQLIAGSCYNIGRSLSSIHSPFFWFLVALLATITEFDQLRASTLLPIPMMSLRISLSPAPSLRGSASHQSPALAAWCPLRRLTASDSVRRTAANVSRDARRGFRASTVRSSLEIVEPTVGQVTEVNKDTFWPLVKAAGPKVVVLDMYTQWCGPCKVIAPKFKDLSTKYLDVVFLKLDCNQDNRPLAKELGIRVVPTFKILKDCKVVKEVTGAKLDELVLAIETAKSNH